jgi:putative SOS response-associated peptidase YedK
MCGRFVQSAETNRYAQMYGARAFGTHVPRYNVTPSTDVLACRWYRNQERELVPLRWGLVPHWAKSGVGNFNLINAKAETIAEKRAYKDSFRRRRCLIPADGFYEWQGDRPPKQPYYIAHRDGVPLSFAGVWDHWEGGRQRVSSCAIICTAASTRLLSIHDRMPAIIRPADYERWLAPTTALEALLAMLVPYEGEDLMAYRVSTAVNDPRNDGPALITKI